VGKDETGTRRRRRGPNQESESLAELGGLGKAEEQLGGQRQKKADKLEIGGPDGIWGKFPRLNYLERQTKTLHTENETAEENLMKKTSGTSPVSMPPGPSRGGNSLFTGKWEEVRGLWEDEVKKTSVDSYTEQTFNLKWGSK